MDGTMEQRPDQQGRLPASDTGTSGATGDASADRLTGQRGGDETATVDASETHTDPRREPPKRVQRRRQIDEIEGSETFHLVREHSRFEDLAVVKPHDGGRYADSVRARALDDGTERGVALGLLDRPESNRDSYADAMADKLARWHAAGDADGVLPVRDWGRRPRPWIAKDPIEETLAEWRPPSTAARLECAHDIARAVAVCHRQGVIHGGLDPGNVVFPAGPLDDDPRPKLDNVGFMLAFRDFFEPADYLDPRYAAPEYFDDSFGGIDQFTDVYQLGAVLHHCFTGRAPFRGTYSDIRQGVLEEDPTPPTELNASLPAALDEVMAKALAKQKLVRYETASQLRADIERICERCGV